MMDFRYERAVDAAAAIRLASAAPAARYLGGGTNLVDLMREDIEQPAMLVDVSGLSDSITRTAQGGLLIGAAAKNTAVAADLAVRDDYPLLAEAILAGASGQIRNMATVGGNILQRTRCYYFYDRAARCNKRDPGAGCDAIEGFNRIHAILGASDHCVATHPSDMCVALAALDAVVHLEGPAGARRLALVDLHRLPGDTPAHETDLAPDELITAIELAPPRKRMQSRYRKVRDRASYAFALVSVAAMVEVGADGIIQEARLALGGVAHKPWRASAAEQVLRYAPATEASFRRAADAELAQAQGLTGNAFKIDLAHRVIVSSLAALTQHASTPGAGS